jgi:hypothetical protein
VSACLDLEFIGSTSQDQGVIIGFLNPASAQYATAADVSSWETSELNTFSLPVRGGARILWRPEDTEDFIYQAAQTTDLNIGATQANSITSPFIGASLVGCAATAVTCRYKLTANYEGLPFTAGLDLYNVSSSPVDIEGTMKVLQAVAEMPSGGSLTGTQGGVFGSLLNQAAMAAPQYLGYASQAFSAYEGLTRGGYGSKFLREYL